MDIDLAKVLYGKQEVQVHRPIPAEGAAIARTRLVDVFDKGTAAVLVQRTEATDEQDDPLCTATASLLARGEGGFGGERGPSDRIDPPERGPDAVLEVTTLPQQALLYRLCGDRNPLHVDPEFARRGGFGRPILHGLCTYGMVAKAVVDAFLDGDPARVSLFGTKFAGVVFPGERLRVRVWREDEKAAGHHYCPGARRRACALGHSSDPSVTRVRVLRCPHVGRELLRGPWPCRAGRPARP